MTADHRREVLEPRQDLSPFIALISENEEWLMTQILHYAKEQGYTKYTSTLKEAWRLSISGLSESLISTLHKNSSLELGPDEDYTRDPVAMFGITEAQRHRQRGIDLGMFLGLMKYYRQSYMDLLKREKFESDYEAHCMGILTRFFDRVELGFCTEWASSEEKERIQELQVNNRMMTNEKNKFLTIFESHPTPVIVLNRENQIDNVNHAAAVLFDASSIPGSQYYGGETDIPAEIPEHKIDERRAWRGSGKRIEELLPWISDELEKFAVDEVPVASFAKKISDGNDEKFYGVKFSRMIDVSGKFSGIIIHLEDLTSQKQAEEEMRKSEALHGVLEMAGAVCHELNQPLQALYGYSQLLMMDIDDKHPLYGRISKIEHQVERVGAITGKLSEITRYKTKDYLKGKIIDIEKATDDAS